jgi:ribonuclease D
MAVNPASETAPAGAAEARHCRISRYIDSEPGLAAYTDGLRGRGIDAVALDLEGDQGTVRYAYSISIVQCFDGTEAVIVDALAVGNSPALRRFLTDPAVTKVMFSCANDLFMAQNVLGCTIAPVRDIAVGQKLLGLPVNLSDHLAIDRRQKDRFQRANWLKRPIRRELLDYAVNDVVHLLSIERGLAARLRGAGLFDAYREESGQLSRKNFVIDHFRHYRAKFPGFSRLGPAQRRAAAAVWVFRELVGRHFDCPVGYILSKKAMAACVRDPQNAATLLERELNHGRSRKKRVDKDFVEKYYQEALRISGKA